MFSFSDVQVTYNTVEYPGFAYPDTHPERLAFMARLYGLEPAPLAACRVLEIGCNEGANIIPCSKPEIESRPYAGNEERSVSSSGMKLRSFGS